MNKRQSGFTLVEIAIVLVIIGLLLGGILKGQELINSARVRNLADLTTGVQAAYFGFIDRYRRVPGDMLLADAKNAIDDGVNGGGNANGRLDEDDTVWDEPNAAWEHLSKAGFIQGEYTGATAEPTAASNQTPLNPWNNPMLIGVSDHYQGAGQPRLHLILGRGVPVGILRELDVKIDDEQPTTGVMRMTEAAADGEYGNLGGMAATCIDTDVDPDIYNVNGDDQDCNAVYLF